MKAALVGTFGCRGRLGHGRRSSGSCASVWACTRTVTTQGRGWLAADDKARPPQLLGMGNWPVRHAMQRAIRAKFTTSHPNQAITSSSLTSPVPHQCLTNDLKFTMQNERNDVRHFLMFILPFFPQFLRAYN